MQCTMKPGAAALPVAVCGLFADAIYASSYTYSYSYAVRGRFMTLSFGDPMPAR